MIEILAMATAISAITSGTVQAVKQTNFIKKEYLPLSAVVIGMLLGAVAVFMDIDLVSRLWAGGVSGLAAVGLFELGKQAIEGDE